MRKTMAVMTAFILTVSAMHGFPARAAEAASLGDCNSDGMVNASDATDVLKYYSSLSTGGDVWASAKVRLADMDGDSKVDSTDASYILSYYSAVSTGSEMTPEKYMEYRTKGFGDFSYYSNIEVRVGNGCVNIKANDISADEYIKQQYPEGAASCAYEVSIYRNSENADGTQKSELVSTETVRKISKGERVYRFYGEEYREPCDVFSAALPQNIETKGCTYRVEVRGHYKIGGVEVTASNVSSAALDTLPLIVNNAKLTPHDAYNLYNIKVSPPAYKATYYVSAADKKILDDFAAEHFTAGMSNYDKIEYTWDWLNKNVTYASGNLYNDIISDSWVSACFVKKKGQCLQYNGALAEMLAYMGYDVYMLEMWLNPDGTNQHFRAEVVIDGQAYSIEVGNNGSYAGWLWLFRPIESSIKGVQR